MSSVRIEVSDLWSGEYHERLGIDAIDADENSHIHGRLTITIGGRELPRLGCFGPDDVCLNDWVAQFLQIRATLGTADGEHRFESCEQGDPVFAFERSGAQIFVSLLSSVIGGGRGDDTWSKVPCVATDFFVAIDRVLDQLRAQILALGPQGEHWWRDVTRATP